MRAQMPRWPMPLGHDAIQISPGWEGFMLGFVRVEEQKTKNAHRLTRVTLVI